MSGQKKTRFWRALFTCHVLQALTILPPQGYRIKEKEVGNWCATHVM
jgi:hypothetical protein